MSDIEHAYSALNHLDASCCREKWVRIGMAAKAAGLTFDDFHEWSKKGDNYKNENDCKTVWKSLDEKGGITAATLFKMASDNGWQNPTKNNSNIQPIKNMNPNVISVWERCLPAESNHEYIVRKRGIIDGVRYYPDIEEPLFIGGITVAGYLVIPCWSNNQIQTLQFIPPCEGKKLNFPGASFADGYFVIGDVGSVIYICEGIGQAWAINQTLHAAAIVCFGFSRMNKIAQVLRSKYKNSLLVIVPDRGKEKQAADIAIQVNGALTKLPTNLPDNYDVNDYLQEYGEDALRNILVNSEIQMPLDVIFADELSKDFEPADELIEGILTAGDGSILYGDSNCGKTFFVIDMACAIARGIDWMGRKTESGLVIYLAAESPASVKRRLQGYQGYHNIRVRNFAIVQNPINLFDGDADSNAIVQVVQMLEKQFGQKARLIVGDTLARLSAGANESAGQDMSLVIRHVDQIRNECNAHFMLIHHSGKNAAAGARGWSGVRAAVDTEIEITDSSSGRCAEITKQRDLDTKGVRIGFRLEPITLGLTKWRSIATSCVVMPADAPKKQSSKRLSEIAGAIIEYLNVVKSAVKKSILVEHLTDRYSSSAIYREIKKLVENRQIIDSSGYVRLIVPTGAD